MNRRPPRAVLVVTLVVAAVSATAIALNTPATSFSSSSPHVASGPTDTTASAIPPEGSGTALGASAASLRVGTPAGIILSPMEGRVVLSPGSVFDGMDIKGEMTIAGTRVVIKRSRIHSDDGQGYGIRVLPGGSVTISDVTISGFKTGVAGDDYTANRVEVTALKDDGFVIGSNVTVQSVWCHDLTPESGAHSDCVQIQSGEVNMAVRDSWLDPGGNGVANSAVFAAPDLGPSSDGPLLISNNVLGGGNYSLYCVDGAEGRFLIGNISILNNRFIRDATYGPVRVNVPVIWRNNAWVDTGASVEI